MIKADQRKHVGTWTSSVPSRVGFKRRGLQKDKQNAERVVALAKSYHDKNDEERHKNRLSWSK